MFSRRERRWPTARSFTPSLSISSRMTSGESAAAAASRTAAPFACFRPLRALPPAFAVVGIVSSTRKNCKAPASLLGEDRVQRDGDRERGEDDQRGHEGERNGSRGRCIGGGAEHHPAGREAVH